MPVPQALKVAIKETNLKIPNFLLTLLALCTFDHSFVFCGQDQLMCRHISRHQLGTLISNSVLPQIQLDIFESTNSAIMAVSHSQVELLQIILVH